MCKLLLLQEILASHYGWLKRKSKYGNRNIKNTVFPESLNARSIQFFQKIQSIPDILYETNNYCSRIEEVLRRVLVLVDVMFYDY